MKNKMTALTLGLLLLAVPGFAQYGGGSGTQTFTVPTLTVGPGPFTVTGTTVFSGGFTVGGDLLLDGTTLGDGFELIAHVGTDPTADFTLTLPSTTNASAMISSLTTNDVDVANSVWGVSNGLAFGGATGANGFELTVAPQNDPVADIAVLIPNLTASAAMVSSLTTNDFNVANSVWGVSNGLTFEGASEDAFENFLTVAEPAGSNKTWTLPNITGTVLLGGATNTLGAVTTTINSGTQFNIHSDANITLDGDADNDGTGTVSILSSNDTQQVLLTNTAISLVSDAQVSAASNDGGGNINTFTAAAAIGSWEVTDGTDIARMQIDATGILIDGDYDNDGDGVVTISVDNSQTALSLAVDSSIMSVSNGTDTSDITITPNVVTINADVDTDYDGEIRLSGAVELVSDQLTVNDTGDGSAPDQTVTVVKGSVLIDCQDADGCTATLTETNISDGALVYIVSVGANTVTLANQANILVIGNAGSRVLGPNDSIVLYYEGIYNSQWLEVGYTDLP